MATSLFVKSIFAGEPIKLFNFGRMRRDFTCIDDVVESVLRLIDRPPAGDPSWSSDRPDPGSSRAPWRVFNIGGEKPEALMNVVGAIERTIGKKAQCELMPMQVGDVIETCADTGDLEREIGFKPSIPLEEGIRRFVDWYRTHYRT